MDKNTLKEYYKKYYLMNKNKYLERAKNRNLKQKFLKSGDIKVFFKKHYIDF